MEAKKRVGERSNPLGRTLTGFPLKEKQPMTIPLESATRLTGSMG
jgi:hypothetical protein